MGFGLFSYNLGARGPEHLDSSRNLVRGSSLPGWCERGQRLLSSGLMTTSQGRDLQLLWASDGADWSEHKLTKLLLDRELVSSSP